MTDIYDNDAIHGDEHLTEMDCELVKCYSEDIIVQASSDHSSESADMIIGEIIESEELRGLLLDLANNDPSHNNVASRILRNKIALDINGLIQQRVIDFVKDNAAYNR